MKNNRETETNYRERHSQWLHLKNLREDLKIWRPCEYYHHQLNTALTSSHSILNNPIFFSLLASKKVLPSRDLLILDEAHLLETEIVKFRGLSISKRRWKKYIQNLEMVDYGYDVENWIEFLIDLETKVLNLTGHDLMTESLSLYRKTKFNWISKKTPRNKKKIVAASELFESDKEIAEKYDIDFFRGSPTISEELAVDALRDTGKTNRNNKQYSFKSQELDCI